MMSLDKPGVSLPNHDLPSVLAAGQLCPNCQLARLVAEPRGQVSCPLCGFTTAPPCT